MKNYREQRYHTNSTHAPKRSNPSLSIQPCLRIGPVDDPAEREAERVADQVMRMPAPVVQHSPLTIQRCSTCAKATSVKEMCPSCAPRAREEALLQRDAATSEILEVTPEVEASIAAMRGGGQSLDAEVRAFMEPRFGHDFSQVRVHTDTRAARTAADVEARAFTVGSDIAFGEGQYQPETMAGRRLIAHELTHVVQQSPRYRDDVSRWVIQRKYEAGEVENSRSSPGRVEAHMDDIVIGNRSGWIWQAPCQGLYSVHLTG